MITNLFNLSDKRDEFSVASTHESFDYAVWTPAICEVRQVQVVLNDLSPVPDELLQFLNPDY